jgi:cytochrome c oxidase cbb3-type subunit 2
VRGLFPLLIGLFGTFAFSWIGLIAIPNSQIGHLNPQSDEEGTDVYPVPKSGMAEEGLRIYVANGCVYCHTQQVRPDYIASDIDRKWGERRSAPRDYIFERPVQLGKERMGPDLSNVGKRAPAEEEKATAATAPAASPTTSVAPAATSPAPSAAPAAAASVSPATGEPAAYSAAWHHRHLFSPRSLNDESNMPAYRFLYEKRPVNGERSADALDLTGSDAPPAGWEIVPTYEAKCLVAYLMSLDQSHPLKEVKTAAGAAPPVSSPAAPPAGSPAAAPQKK